MTASIARAETPDDLDAVRTLIREFHHWAMTEVSPGANPATFANMDAERNVSTNEKGRVVVAGGLAVEGVERRAA